MPDRIGQYFEGKHVLVAGGTGTIGIPLVRALCACGAQVRVVSMDPEAYAQQLFGNGVEYMRADLTELAACLAATDGQDHVFNMVGIKGSTGIGQTKVASYLVPMLWFQTNLMEAAFRNKASRYLFVSSVCTYPQSDYPKKEDDMWNGLPKQNDRIPGLAKRIGEIQGESYLLEYGWDAVRIVRPANVYGPYDDFNPATAQVVPSLIRRCLDGENPLSVWGDGSAVRDFVFSEDVARWCMLAMIYAPCCLPLNLGSGHGITIKELAETVVRVSMHCGQIQWQPDKPVGDPVRILSMERTQGVLGDLEETPLAEGLRRTIEWFKNEKDVMNLKIGAAL